MPQNGKKQNIKGSDKEKAKPVVQTGEGLNKRTAIILAVGVVALILIIIGVIGYPTYVAPFRRTIINVDNISLNMNYFLKRVKLSGSDPIAMMTTLTNEQIIKLGAPKLVGIPTQADIDQEMRTEFQGQTGNVSSANSDREFNAWHRQILNESGLSSSEYRDIIYGIVLRIRLQDLLAKQMPTAVEQAHVFVISVNTIEEAETVRTRWAAGENFTALAKELSLDKTTAQNGGEIGWFPKGGVLTAGLETAAFELSTGNISDPIPVVADQEQSDGTTAPAVVGYQVLMVPERAIRELDPNSLQILQSKVVDDWLTAERKNYTIVWHGLKDGFDSETYAWIQYQIAKNNPASNTTTPGK
jgi:hypothetical protein